MKKILTPGRRPDGSFLYWYFYSKAVSDHPMKHMESKAVKGRFGPWFTALFQLFLSLQHKRFDECFRTIPDKDPVIIRKRLMRNGMACNPLYDRPVRDDAILGNDHDAVADKI